MATNTLGIFIIHVDGARERRAFMQDQMTRAGLHDAVWVRAIDWRAPDYRPRGGLRIQRDDVLVEHNWDGRIYVRGEDAIFQSHLRALETFIASGKAFGVIFEDDAELAPDFPEAIGATLGHAADWDMICLEGFRPWGGRPAIRVAKAGTYTLVASLNPCAGSAAYLVTRRGAEQLVAHASEVIEPFDNYLNAHWRHGLRVLDLSPFPVRQGAFVSLRQESRRARRRSPLAAFGDWRRHIYADFVGRYLRRWWRQVARFGVARLTIARWSRNWSAASHTAVQRSPE